MHQVTGGPRRASKQQEAVIIEAPLLVPRLVGWTLHVGCRTVPEPTGDRPHLQRSCCPASGWFESPVFALEHWLKL